MKRKSGMRTRETNGYVPFTYSQSILRSILKSKTNTYSRLSGVAIVFLWADISARDTPIRILASRFEEPRFTFFNYSQYMSISRKQHDQSSQYHRRSAQFQAAVTTDVKVPPCLAISIRGSHIPHYSTLIPRQTPISESSVMAPAATTGTAEEAASGQVPMTSKKSTKHCTVTASVLHGPQDLRLASIPSPSRCHWVLVLCMRGTLTVSFFV
jgi:hypothetical protein